MTNSLSWPVEYVIFSQGLLLMVLAARAIAMEKPDQPLPWLWLAMAAVFQGLERWLGLLTSVVTPGPAQAIGRMLLLAASTAFLAHFAQRGTRESRSPWAFVGPLFGLLLLAGFFLGSIAREATVVPVSFAAGLWAAAALWRASRRTSGRRGFFLRVEGISLAISSLATGAALSASPYLPGAPAAGIAVTGSLALQIKAWQTVPVALMALALYGYALVCRPDGALFPHRTARNRFTLGTWAALILILGLGMGATYYAGLGARHSLEIQGSAKVDDLAGLVDRTLSESDHYALSLAQSSVLIQALATGTPLAIQAADQVLTEHQKAFQTSVCYLMNARGQTLASSNFASPDSFVGHNYGFRPYFQEAMAGQAGSYFARGVTSLERGYYASSPVRDNRGRIIGVAVVEKNLNELEPAWTPYQQSYLIDPNGVIFLSGQPGLRFETLWPLDASTRDNLLQARQFGPEPLTASLQLPDQVANNTLAVTGGRSFLVNRELIGHSGWSVVVLSPDWWISGERLLVILVTMLVALATTVLLLAAEKTCIRTEEAVSSAANYHTIFNAVNDGILVLDARTGAILEVNQKAGEMFGWQPEELRRLTIHELGADLPGYSPENIRQTLQKAVSGQSLMFEWLARDKSGRCFWTEVNLKPAGMGGETRLLLVVRDITSRKDVEEALRTSEATYRTIFEKSGLALIMVEEDTTLSLISPAFAEAIGYTREEIEGRKTWSEFVYPEDLAKVLQYSRLRRMFPRGAPSTFEFRVVDRRGRVRTLLATATVIPGTLRSVVALVDITTRKAMEERLRYLSLHDVLTDLRNRASFEKHIRRLNRYGTESVGIIVCDVDGLKLVNDTLGHRAGDEQLLAAANVIRKCLGPDGTIARIGGDEFAILLPQAGCQAVEAAVTGIREAVAAYNRNQPSIPLSLSLGWAAGRPGAGETDLFREADNNMYREKLFSSQSGRSAIVLALVKTLEARGSITTDHVNRLLELATGVGRKLGWAENRVTTLRLLARFHDIGKIGIPDHILLKPGPLTPEETLEMRRHTRIGHRIAQSTPDLAPIADLIVKHHEWWNGQGYPFGLQGEEIPLESRIIAIIDTYDAMTSDRPYRKAVAPAEAVAELRRCAGTQFDPVLVATFIDVLAGRTDSC